MLKRAYASKSKYLLTGGFLELNARNKASISSSLHCFKFVSLCRAVQHSNPFSFSAARSLKSPSLLNVSSHILDTNSATWPYPH